jgi:hypothetical protein
MYVATCVDTHSQNADEHVGHVGTKCCVVVGSGWRARLGHWLEGRRVQYFFISLLVLDIVLLTCELAFEEYFADEDGEEWILIVKEVFGVCHSTHTHTHHTHTHTHTTTTTTTTTTTHTTHTPHTR